MKALSAGKVHGSVERPALIHLVLETRAGYQRLRRGKRQVLHTPRPDIFSQHCERCLLAKLMLDAGPCAGCKELADQRMEQEIAHGITSDQRVAAPGASHLKLQARAQIPGMQVLQVKRAG